MPAWQKRQPRVQPRHEVGLVKGGRLGRAQPLRVLLVGAVHDGAHRGREGDALAGRREVLVAREGAARRHGVNAKAVLGEPIEIVSEALAAAEQTLLAGLDDGRYAAAPASLFELRIRLAGIVLEAAQLELQAAGGRAYHRDQPLGFARRWREAAFIPIVTPSLSQLRGELLAHRERTRLATAA
jgi:hypothetical protein